MEHFGLMPYFETLIGREHVENPKPHKEPIMKALEAMQIKHKRVWIIGDTHLDIVSANNAGIDHIAVTSGYESENDLRKHTDLIVSNVLEAVNSIKKFIK